MYRTNQYTGPPRPRSYTLWIVLGVVGVLVLIGIASAAAFFLGSRVEKSKVVAVPRASASSVPTASVTPAQSAPNMSLAPPPDPVDEPAPPPGTPAASLRARPPWGIAVGIRGTPTQQYAPQLGKPLEVFLEAKPMSGDLSRAFVMCRFQSFNKADTLAGDDLHVRAHLGTTPEIATDGPEDGNLAFLSAPLVTLKKGEAVRFEVFDRDVFSLVPITRSSVTYDAAPIVSMDAGAAIECRALQGADHARVFAAKAGVVDAALGTLGRHRLSGTERTWGWPTFQILAAQRALTDVAALAGWDDARVKKRVEAFTAANQAIDAQRAELFESLHKEARAAVVIGTVRVTLVELVCGGSHGAAGTCVAKVSLQNEGTATANLGGIVGITSYVATAGSGPVTAYPDGKPLQKVVIEPHTSIETRLVASGPVTGLETEPAILGFCHERLCGTLRAR